MMISGNVAMHQMPILFTQKWMTVVGIWCPCIGPDTFQECISFYLKKQIKNKNLELVSNDIDLQGESVSEGMNLSKDFKELEFTIRLSLS